MVFGMDNGSRPEPAHRKKYISFTLDADKGDQLEEAARAKGISSVGLVRMIVLEALAREIPSA